VSTLTQGLNYHSSCDGANFTSVIWQASAMLVDDFGRDLAGIQALQRKQEVAEKDMSALFQQIQVTVCVCT